MLNCQLGVSGHAPESREGPRTVASQVTTIRRLSLDVSLCPRFSRRTDLDYLGLRWPAARTRSLVRLAGAPSHADRHSRSFHPRADYVRDQIKTLDLLLFVCNLFVIGRYEEALTDAKRSHHFYGTLKLEFNNIIKRNDYSIRRPLNSWCARDEREGPSSEPLKALMLQSSSMGSLHKNVLRRVDLSETRKRFVLTSANEPKIQTIRQGSDKSTFNLSSLPPTQDTARFHTFRVYHQVQSWLGNYNDLEDWGWKKCGKLLMLVQNSKPPAPPELLKLIFCKCKGNVERCVDAEKQE
ncbi:hypothetical protein EVAR_46021_1 [Eumeta japonica]|uniref:Uncharacterized protein n=1 Tax=Eumeta variegata TaxID=151549 RepID=A0A4C1Z4M2_EUMVA|nr:hypothetical protein EVAR_46021_1 [Eumeta japonica]